jgi:hypothetical protein
MKVPYRELKTRGIRLETFDKAAFEALKKEVSDFNEALYQQKLAERQVLLDAAEKHYGGKNSADYKSLKRRTVPKPPDFKRRVSTLKRRIKKWETNQRIRAYNRERRTRLKAANALLEKLGYVPDVDYKSNAAIRFMNRILKGQHNGQNDGQASQQQESYSDAAAR